MKRTTVLAIGVLALGCDGAFAQEVELQKGTLSMSEANLDNFAGQPVDLSPWAYTWRADRTVQEKPEAYFIPRRLNRIDTVYRTALGALGPDKIKSIHYQQEDLLKPLLPAP